MSYEKSVEEYKRQNVPRPGNPSYNEAWALIEAARRIAAVVQFGDLSQIEDKRKIRDALRLNLRVWTIIQAEQTAGESMLPADLRQNILTLCKFIDNRTMEMLIEPSLEKAAVLININQNIAAGLLGSAEAAEIDPEDSVDVPAEDVAEERENVTVDI